MNKRLQAMFEFLGFGLEENEEDQEELEETEEEIDTEELDEEPNVPELSVAESEKEIQPSPREKKPLFPKKTFEKSNISVDTVKYGDGQNEIKIVNMQANVSVEMVVANPETLKEAKELVKCIREQKPVLVKLDVPKISKEQAQRVTDFLLGATYACNGSIRTVARNTYICIPENMNLEENFNFSSIQEKKDIKFQWSD